MPEDCFHPILDCAGAHALERRLLQGAKSEWVAMNRAGRSLGRAVLRDFRELADWPAFPRILVVMGKGHNGGDALLAADEIRRVCPATEIHVLASAKPDKWRTHTREAYRELEQSGKILPISLPQLKRQAFDVSLDGLLGMQFKAPLREAESQILEALDTHPSIRFRVAVDLPSGLGDPGAARADFTYATGILKTPLLDPENREKVGRIRYLDIGFFDEQQDSLIISNNPYIITRNILHNLRQLRNPLSDKRTYGHLFILAGSTSMPGALLMNVQAALRSGVGLVTAFAPESIVAACAAAAPEAMWVACPETSEGSLALSGKIILQERIHRATALLAGSGMGSEPETRQLLCELVRESKQPMVLDADALYPDVMEAASMRDPQQGAVVITPHMGEFMRLGNTCDEPCNNDSLLWFSHKNNLVTVLKGPVTRISDGKCIAYVSAGGPVLARGGSGDILAGLTGGLIARELAGPSLRTAAQAVIWLGCTADRLARAQGHTAAATSDLLRHLAPALRETE